MRVSCLVENMEQGPSTATYVSNDGITAEMWAANLQCHGCTTTLQGGRETTHPRYIIF